MSDHAVPFASTLDDHAWALLEEGRVEAALEVAQTALSAERQSAEDSGSVGPGLIKALEQLGLLQRELGDVAQSEAALCEALELAMANGESLGRQAALRTNLATLLDFSQREADAVPLYEQAIADYEAMEPAEAEVAAQLRNNLAMIYKGLGKFAMAEQHYLKALEVLEAVKGSQSEDVAAVYNNLGGLYYTAGFAEQAKDMFTEGMKTRVALLGPNHVDVAQSHSNLATVCHELGDSSHAIDHFEQSLRILEAHIKDEAASFEAVGSDYAAMLELLGEDRRAAALRKRLQKTLALV
jgi:tetratricopeptide (TPR) repeat protein